MTFEELQAEAEKQGYILRKRIKPLGKMAKCPLCGKYPKVNRQWGIGDWYVYCPGHLEGPHINTDTYYINTRTGDKVYYPTDTKHDNELKAREAWNEMVNNYKEEET